MNCLRRKCFSLILSLSLLLTLVPSSVSADYTSIALSPATGTIYADYTALSLVVNSGTDEFTAVDVNISFTGAVEYMSATAGSICGGSFEAVAETGTLSVLCFKPITASPDPYNGVIATLYFRSTGTGTSTFTFSSTDPNILTKTGGTYTLSTANNPVPRGGTGSGSLPESGIFDDTRGIIGIGAFFMLFGIFFNQINNVAVSFLGSIKEIQSRRREEKVNRRRGKLEKKF